ncbi:hypothetical protein N180_10730 [Pedobacter antarcticus 4BY]|uniref:Uncharacterized protein n=1 Tax=Pedobacter antarcticus 4BY TaxID=1358423 RepID=A0A081PL85_9SPHI|nr:hypothetical protein N180_10730 [Pedobacter antarcticus 4BY]
MHNTNLLGFRYRLRFFLLQKKGFFLLDVSHLSDSNVNQLNISPGGPASSNVWNGCKFTHKKNPAGHERTCRIINQTNYL